MQLLGLLFLSLPRKVWYPCSITWWTRENLIKINFQCSWPLIPTHHQNYSLEGQIRSTLSRQWTGIRSEIVSSGPFNLTTCSLMASRPSIAKRIPVTGLPTLALPWWLSPLAPTKNLKRNMGVKFRVMTEINLNSRRLLSSLMESTTTFRRTTGSSAPQTIRNSRKEGIVRRQLDNLMCFSPT